MHRGTAIDGFVVVVRKVLTVGFVVHTNSAPL
jgi:hypothetical protein